MNVEQVARSIGEAPSCECGCASCGQNIHTLYRGVLDQAAWVRELERRSVQLVECLRVALMHWIQFSGNRTWGATEAEQRKRCVDILRRFNARVDDLVPPELQHGAPGNGRKA